MLALMCDSTNALRPGFTMSERTVGATFDKIFNDNKNSRLIIATFASNVDRVQQIINSAVAYGRKVCVEGRSMVNIIEVAENLDYLKIPEGTLIDTEEMKNYPPEQIVLITTGSQGEWRLHFTGKYLSSRVTVLYFLQHRFREMKNQLQK